jgi:hypothetical protein
MAQDNEPLRVEGGYLNRPYPINSMADVHRAKVLPPPRSQRLPPPPKKARPSMLSRVRSAASSISRKLAPADDTPSDPEQPRSAFDSVLKRNQMLKKMSDREPSRARRNGSRRS